MHFVKPGWLNSLSFKVLLAYVIGTVLTITLVSLLIFWLVYYQSAWLAGEDVADFTQDMAKELLFDSQGNPVGFHDDDGDLNWVFDSLREEAAYRVLDESGRTVLVSEAGEGYWLPNEMSRRLRTGKFEFEHDGLLFHGATSSVKYAEQIWYIQFAVSSRFFFLIHRGLALPFVGGGIVLFSVVLLFVFGACTYVTLGYTLKPLRDLSESATAISPRSLNARLSSKGVPSEISPLVESFNRVLERLENGYRIQREFLTTAAHELKTPLALIRAQIEVKEAGDDRDALLNDVAHMSRQVQQLLMLAEVSEEQNFNLDYVAISVVVNEVISYLQPMSKAADVGVELFILNANIRWQADRSALFVLLKNLLENAIQHAPRDTEVHMEITPSMISVRDWGPGIKREHLPHVFARFWRGAHRRDHGAGLGLAICQEITKAHGWTVNAENATPGARFVVNVENGKNING